MAHPTLALAAAAIALCGAASAQSLSLELVTNGVQKPVHVTAPAGDTARIFVLEKEGRVRIVKNGSLLATPFLAIEPLVSPLGERGLLGLAFHPDYDQNGRFFVNYTDTVGDTQVVEYAVSADPDVALSTPVQTIFSQFQPNANHNGGDIAFRDGKLYIGMGDGGPSANAQNPTSNLGKMIRLDVDLPPPFIPPDNPFVGVPGTNDEIWALGLRNPWRWSFDRETGDLWIGDVGAGSREEVSFTPASSTGGENYGWVCMEGNLCTGAGPCACDAPHLTPPVHDYDHSFGCAIVGGYVYRGSAMPALRGTYFFADYCSSRVWGFRLEGTEVVSFQEYSSQLSSPGFITAFGEDADGELYLCSTFGGSVWKIVRDCGAAKYCAAKPNSTGERAELALTGSSSIAANSLDLQATDLPLNQNGYFLLSASQDFLPLFGGGEGDLCLGSPIVRFAQNVLSSGASGTMGFTPDLASLPQGTVVSAGETWYFQLWYRDANPQPTSNTSEGLSILFCP